MRQRLEKLGRTLGVQLNPVQLSQHSRQLGCLAIAILALRSVAAEIRSLDQSPGEHVEHDTLEVHKVRRVCDVCHVHLLVHRKYAPGSLQTGIL